jgi:hypothetical protein
MRLWVLLTVCCAGVGVAQSRKRPETARSTSDRVERERADRDKTERDKTERDKEEARAEKERGDEAFDTDQFDEALKHYERAWELGRSPALLYNRARTHERMNQFPQALALLEQFAFEADAALMAKVPKLDELLARYRQKTTRLRIRVAAPDVEVRLGNRILGKSPLPQPLVVSSGPAELLTIQSDTFLPVQKLLDLPAGGAVEVTLELAPRASRAVLRVTSEYPGALAHINDDLSGSVPFEAVVVPGTHRISLTKEGFIPAVTSVLVGAGETKVVELGLNPEKRWFERWYVWAAIGVVVVAAAATAIAWSIEKPPPRGSLNGPEVPFASRFLADFIPSW